jgi:hypothetical protein
MADNSSLSPTVGPAAPQGETGLGVMNASLKLDQATKLRTILNIYGQL